ncbi:MAG TPA: SMP-30/gluconolactonase/LRE family protein [Acidimicrobiales bacterium]|nr:SMP-30/gluconolactonase/LRE family protein [Acidimicrobiales bacterium]
MDTKVLVEGRAFLEGPRWREDRLWFSDVPAGEVLTVDMDGRCETVAAIEGSPSGLGWLPDGTLLVARGVPAAVVAVPASGQVRIHADLTGVAEFPPNDMVVDSSGRAWLGTCDIGGIPKPSVSQIICVEPDGSAWVADTDMRFPNGSVITPDGQTLIVAETFGAALTSFDLGSGGLTGKRQWASVPGCLPDGICLDAEGAVWLADAGGQAAVRVRQGGEVLERVDVGRGCYACTLGGPDGRTLFLLTGEFGPPGRALETRPGRIETVTVDVPGAGSP